MSEDSFSLLLTGAEISVAFVGFASLVGVFLSRGDGALAPRARIALTSMLDYGLFSLLACGIPLLLDRIGVDDRSLWRVSSGLFVAANLAYVLASLGFYREVARLNALHRELITRAMLVGDAAALIALALNALSWPFGDSQGAYVGFAVFWFLLGSAASFRHLITQVWTEYTDAS